MSAYKYSDIIFEIKGQIGIIKFNRPSRLNSFGGNLVVDTIHALRVLDSHPDTVFTVITGVGRFFSSGADVKAEAGRKPTVYNSDAVKKLDFLAKVLPPVQLVRAMIDHKKVLVVAMNGPAVGGGAAWFPGAADIVLASTTTYLQCPFMALGLVPEFGSAGNFPQSMGVHRANDFLMLGRKLSAEELEKWGLVNYIFEHEGFHERVVKFLEEQLEVNDGVSMMEHKRLMNAPLRDKRILAVHDAADALAERFVADATIKRFAEKNKLLEAKSKSKSKL